ncbi:MAG: hypothetical protein JWN03_5240, partial [Nocardia sp.]|uniref:hypothetical protein n=1 Tax=Nocardia sp. TaxID=1821 RepID=UPI00262AD190
MTKPSTAPTAAPTELTSDPTADSKLRSLFAADGLFLRAEHLDQIQRYAEEYALAAGVSAASGVDYGLSVTIDGTGDGKSLVVLPGLAVDKSRRPLRLSAPTRIPLSLDHKAAELWIVEIVAAAAPIPAGLEPVYGTLCDDPCSGGALAPWRDAAVVIRVRPEHRIPGPTPAGLKRSQLASAYFALERSESDPWLPPKGATPLLKRPW